MHRAFLAFAQTLLIEPRCPICDGPWQEPQAPTSPCRHCRDALQLPPEGIKGLEPLRWCALGPYEGALRQLLLKVRQPTKQNALATLVQMLSDSLSLPSTVMLVPMHPGFVVSQPSFVPSFSTIRSGAGEVNERGTPSHN